MACPAKMPVIEKADHVGGLFCLLPDIAVKKIYDHGAVLTGNDFWEEYKNLARLFALKREIPIHRKKLNFGNLKFHIISPSELLFKDLNADSIAMKMRYGEITFLFAADLNIKAEKRIRKGLNLQSRVLKAGHHGALQCF